MRRLSLPKWVQGAIVPSLEVTWYSDDAPLDLTGATLSGLIRAGSETRSIAGALVITDAPNGVFLWDFSAADVATHGNLSVQFTATYANGVAKTFRLQWEVERALSAG